MSCLGCISFIDSQLQCTIELNNRKTWTKHIRLKQTLHDMHHNETNVRSHSDSGGEVSQYHIQQSVIKGGMMLKVSNL